jgi:hypothetical protein
MSLGSQFVFAVHIKLMIVTETIRRKVNTGEILK